MQRPGHFQFYNKTKICSGNAALESIPFELENMGSSRPFVITGKKSTENGIVNAFIKSFYDSGVTIGVLFDEMPEHASAVLTGELYILFHAGGCDSIIAIGGEAASSAARGLNLLVSNKTDTLHKIRDIKKSAPLKPYIYIPTSEARGTETSDEAIIDSKIYKSESLYADLVVIDKRMMNHCEKKDTASAAMLALTQSIEACSLSGSNPFNISFARASIEMVYDNLACSLRPHFNKKHKVALMNGVAISGIVYSNAGEGIARAASFETEKITGIPAGICAGIILPYSLDYRLRSDEGGIAGELLLPLAGIENYCSVPEEKRASKSVELLYLLLDNLEGIIPPRLKDLNIPDDIIKKLAKGADARTGGRYGKNSFLKILEHAWDGTPFDGGKSR